MSPRTARRVPIDAPTGSVGSRDAEVAAADVLGSAVQASPSAADGHDRSREATAKAEADHGRIGYGRYARFTPVALAALLAVSVATIGLRQLGSDVPAARPGQLVGESAPDVALTLLDGTPLRLTDLRGSVVVLNFWASWCGPCEDEAPELEAAWRSYRSRGLVVLGVDAEDLEQDAKEFVREHGITYPVVRDRDGSVIRDYQVKGFPVTYVIDRRGNIVDRAFVGPVDGSDETLARFRDVIERALAS